MTRASFGVPLLVACLLACLACLPSPANAREDATYLIELDGGEVLEARGVEMAPNDVVRYLRRDGSVGYVSATRVQRIFDSMGVDFTDVVLKRRGRVGGSIPDIPKYRSFCFQGGDKSCCGGFLLIEAGVLFPITGHTSGQDIFGLVELGGMANVASRSAIGASAFLESGSDFSRAGIRLRYRRWLARRVSLELSSGVVLGGNEPFDAPGLVGQVSINGGDLMSLVIEAEHDNYKLPAYAINDPMAASYFREHASDTTLRVGVRGGSFVGAGAIGLTVVGYVVLLAVLISSGGWD